MLLAPSLPPDEIDSEREVVLEEIAMYEDEPQDRVHDVLAEAMYGDHPLGRRVLGRADVIGGIPVPDIASYHDARYTADNIVVAAAGHLDHERIAELAQRTLQPPAGNGAGTRRRGSTARRRGSPSTRRRPSSTTSASAARDLARRRAPLRARGPRHDLRRLGFLAPLPRGSREARTRLLGRLLHAEFVDSGFVAMYVGTRADNVAEACEIIGRELAKLSAEGVSDDELARAKEHVKGRMVLGLESTSARMGRLPAR